MEIENLYAVLIKTCDRIHNLNSMLNVFNSKNKLNIQKKLKNFLFPLTKIFRKQVYQNINLEYYFIFQNQISKYRTFVNYIKK